MLKFAQTGADRGPETSPPSRPRLRAGVYPKHALGFLGHEYGAVFVKEQTVSVSRDDWGPQGQGNPKAKCDNFTLFVALRRAEQLFVGPKTTLGGLWLCGIGGCGTSGRARTGEGAPPGGTDGLAVGEEQLNHAVALALNVDLTAAALLGHTPQAGQEFWRSASALTTFVGDA